MNIRTSSGFVVAAIASLFGAPLLPSVGGVVFAQGRPEGASRPWVEVGAEFNSQSQNCSTCTRNGNAAGPAVVGAVGMTITRRFGIALAGRKFQEYNYDHAQHSDYIFIVGQSVIPNFANLTLNIGVGYARHDGDRTDMHVNRGSGAAISIGSALRMPAKSPLAFTINTNIMRNVGGSSDFKPTTLAIGIGLNLSPACHSSHCRS